MSPDATSLDRIHRLWDELADFDAASIDAARDHLLSGLCALIDAQNACWFGAVRLGDPLPEDPVRGWRPYAIHFLHASQPLADSGQAQIRELEAGTVDLTTLRNISFAGQFRSNRLVDLAPPEWFDGDYYRLHYRALGREDAIWAGVPINEDAEVYIGIFCGADRPRFTPEERDVVAYALRGLRWFHRQQMLGHGLLVASAPLTPVERGVLLGLLAGLSEKRIAVAQNQSYHTTHEYVRRIFRKYGVKNRAALMVLWLGGSR